MLQVDNITKRCWVHLGYNCNNKCLFCYYRDSLKLKDKSTNTIKKVLRKLKNKGITDIELIGGEPTIRKDIFEILLFAKHLGFKDIRVITNGSKTYKTSFCKELIKNGTTSFLFSIEGDNQELHDSLTQTEGSFQKIIESMKNMKKLRISFQTNTTITKLNYENLPDLAKLLLKFKPRIVNFLIYWPFDDGKNHYSDMAPKLSVVKPFLVSSIEILKERVEDINLRYFPFCVLSGYERYICGYHQKLYDQEQWNNLVMDQIKYGGIINFYHILKGILSFKNKFRMLKLPFKNLINESVVEFIVSKHFTHPKSCKPCRNYFICNGFWKQYITLYGAKEIRPVYGQKIYDSLFFRRRK